MGMPSTSAPVFLEYQVFKLVDLRDPGGQCGDSSLDSAEKGPDEHIRCQLRWILLGRVRQAIEGSRPRPGAGNRLLRLDELVDAGYVHEVWFFTSGVEDRERASSRSRSSR